MGMRTLALLHDTRGAAETSGTHVCLSLCCHRADIWMRVGWVDFARSQAGFANACINLFFPELLADKAVTASYKNSWLQLSLAVDVALVWSSSWDYRLEIFRA